MVRADDFDQWLRKLKDRVGRLRIVERLDRLAAGSLSPIVAERIPMAEASRAHELLERGGHVGKVVLITDA